MLVTCPECGSKISGDSEECKRCGLPNAGHRSKEYFEHLSKTITQITIYGVHKEHETKTIISETETLVRYAVPVEDDIIRFQSGAAKDSRGKYHEILEFNVEQREYGAVGYQLNCLLRCLLCNKMVRGSIQHAECKLYPILAD